MVDLKVLAEYGCTNGRLREVFTAKPPGDGENLTPAQLKQRYLDIKTRERFQKRDNARINEGILFNLKNYTLWAAVDLAWDTSHITKEQVPLLLYAQGKIDIQQCYSQLSNVGCADQFVKKDDKGNVTGIDLPEFFKTPVRLVRSVVTRRLAAQSNKFKNLWPFYSYESRSTGMVGKVRADAMSQRADIMADQYNYRHHEEQVERDTLLYGHSVDFVRSAWEVERQWEFEFPDNPEIKNKEGRRPVKEVIVKQGLDFCNPHPSRVWWDNSEPLANINTDTGPKWLFYWDVFRWRDIADNPAYFNRQGVGYSSVFWDIYRQYSTTYFSQYLSAITIPCGAISADVAAQNDRKAQVGLYASERGDESVVYTQMFEKIVPSAEGIGDYPFPVWVRRTVVADGTTVHAEFLPSTPAAYCGLNENDARQVNISMAHEIMPFEDMMGNLVTNMLLTIQAELLKVITINRDTLGDNPDEAKHNLGLIRAQLDGRIASCKPILIDASIERWRDLGIKVDDVLKINETKAGQSLTSIFQGMLQLISIMERLLALSPAEQGQPAPREISATEVTEIATTTSTMMTFISDAFDEYRAARKRIIYESTVVCQKGEMRLPVVNRYSEKVITDAGFKVVKDENEDFSDPNIRRRTIIGTARNLAHDFIFTTRDGAERPVNTQAANTLVQALNTALAVPGMLQSLGKEKVFNLFNDIFRLSGSGVDVIWELGEGEDNSFGADEIEQLKPMIQQLGDAVKNLSESVSEQEQINAEQQKALGMVNQLAQQVKGLAEKHNRMEATMENKPPSESMNYKDAPPSIRAQMEEDAGYTPASEAERERAAAMARPKAKAA